MTMRQPIIINILTDSRHVSTGAVCSILKHVFYAIILRLHANLSLMSHYAMQRATVSDEFTQDVLYDWLVAMCWLITLYVFYAFLAWDPDQRKRCWDRLVALGVSLVSCSQ